MFVYITLILFNVAKDQPHSLLSENPLTLQKANEGFAGSGSNRKFGLISIKKAGKSLPDSNSGIEPDIVGCSTHHDLVVTFCHGIVVGFKAVMP